MARKKKVTVTPSDVVQYLLGGGDVQSLLKGGNVSQKQLLATLISSPQLLQSYKSQAANTAKGLDNYIKYVEGGIYSQDPSVYQSNYIQDRYNTMEAPAKNFSNAYFQAYAAAGGNPIRVAEIDKQFSDPSAADTYGIPKGAISALFNQVKKDAPSWYSKELEVNRANEMANYKAYQAQRKTLGMQQGETASEAAMRKSTGFGEFANLPSSDLTFEEIAKKQAMNKYKTKREETINKLPATRVDAYLQSQSPTDAATASRQSAAAEASRKIYEKAFMDAVQKKFGAGATPYSVAIRKMLPVIASRLKIQG